MLLSSAGDTQELTAPADFANATSPADADMFNNTLFGTTLS
jgi:hypothetical protein